MWLEISRRFGATEYYQSVATAKIIGAWRYGCPDLQSAFTKLGND